MKGPSPPTIPIMLRVSCLLREVFFWLGGFLGKLVECPYCSCFFFSERDLYIHRKAKHWDHYIEKLFEAVRESRLKKSVMGWTLVGHGSSYADCGTIGAKGCDNVLEHPDGKMFVRLFKRSCFRRECPVCFEKWSSRRAEKILLRLVTSIFGKWEIEGVINDFRRQTKKYSRKVFHLRLQHELEDMLKNYRRKKVIHVVISPPKMFPISLEIFHETKKRVYDIAREVNLKGGCCVFHPYRFHCSECNSPIDDYKEKCSKCGSSDLEWVWSPHFHILGFGWIVHVKEVFESSGWVVKNLGVRKSVFWTAQYILSHAGVFTDSNLHKNRRVHTITWFGDLAYCKLKGAVIHRFIDVCPYCDRFLKRVEYVGLDRPPPYSKDPLKNDFLTDRGLYYDIRNKGE